MLFTINLPIHSIDSYRITKSYQMGILETTPYQIQVCDLNLGVLDTKKIENHCLIKPKGRREGKCEL